MRCLECGSQMESRIGNHRYTECGLDYVILMGIESRECAACGEQELVISKIAQLHRAIAKAVVEKKGRLEGQDIRFLRKFLGLSAVDFAAQIGSKAETVSRWENNHRPISVTQDRLLRLMVLNERPKASYPLEKLAQLTVGESSRVAIRAHSLGDSWSAETSPVA